MTAAISAERISDLIGAIYDSALDPSLWPAALDRIRLELGFFSATLAVVEFPGGVPILQMTAGIPETWRAWMPGCGADVVAMWGGPECIGRYPLDEPVVQSQAASRVLMETNRRYQEWLQPQGILDGVAITFARDGDLLGTIGLRRHGDAGEIGERELAVLRIIAPHFRRAVSISKLLDLQSVQVRSFAAALDAVAAGILLVDARMQVLHANDVAAGMLRSADMILTRRGELRLADTAATGRLQAAVSAGGRGEVGNGRRAGDPRAGPRADGRSGGGACAAAAAGGDALGDGTVLCGGGVRRTRAGASAAAAGRRAGRVV